MIEFSPVNQEPITSSEGLYFISDGKAPENSLSETIKELADKDPRWEDLYQRSIEICKEYRVDFVVYDSSGTVDWDCTVERFKDNLSTLGWEVDENSKYPEIILSERNISSMVANAVSSPDNKVLHLKGSLDSAHLETLVHEYCHIKQIESGKALTPYEREFEAYTSSLQFSTLNFIQDGKDPYEEFLKMVKVSAMR